MPGQRFYERRDGESLMRLWADPADYTEVELQGLLADLEELQGLSDTNRAYVAQALGNFQGLAGFDDYLDEEIGRVKDILDFFTYDKVDRTFQTADGLWFTPEAVEAVCGEEVGFEAANMLDDTTSTYWQHDTDELHTVDLRLRSYKKKVNKIRIRRGGSNRSELTDLDIYYSNKIGGLDNPNNLVVTGATLATPSDWNEVAFTNNKRGKYLRLQFRSAHGSNEARIRRIEAWVITHDYA